MQRARIGLVPTMASGPMFIAARRGYFEAEGLDVEIVTFDSAQALAVSLAAGDLDFGATSLAVGFYNLAGRGVMRMIGAQGRDNAGFPTSRAMPSPFPRLARLCITASASSPISMALPCRVSM